jgi:hypothetical protein
MPQVVQVPTVAQQPEGAGEDREPLFAFDPLQTFWGSHKLGYRGGLMPLESVSVPARSVVGGIRPKLVAAVLFLAFLASAIVHAFNRNIPAGFDELAHVSFVAQVQQCACLPALDDLLLLDPVTRTFTSASSYLNHPATYYAALSVGPDITTSLPTFRLFNVLLVGVAMVLQFATLFRVVIEPLQRIAGAVLIGTVPVMGLLAGSVNNDNLAMLGGALTIFGGARYIGGNKAADLAILCAGVLVASLAKLTGLLLCGVFLAVILLQAKNAPRHFLIAAAATAVAALPYILLTLKYGSPAPHTAGQMQMLADGARDAGWDRQLRLGPLAYFFFFCRSMLEGWMPRLGGPTTLQHLALLLPLTVLAFAALHSWRDRLCRAGAVAVGVMFAVHMSFSYQRHLETGWMLDAYPRYYFPMLGVLPLAMARALQSSPKNFAYPAIAAPLVFALLG